jgi:hypothetical protein
MESGQGHERKQSWPISKHYPYKDVKGLSKTMIFSIWISNNPCQDQTRELMQVQFFRQGKSGWAYSWAVRNKIGAESSRLEDEDGKIKVD